MCSSLKARRHTIIFALFFLLLSPLRSPAQPTVLHLKNGDRLTGRIVSEDTNSVVLTTTWMNVVVVPLDQIKDRELLAAPAPGAAPAAPPSAPPTPAPKAVAAIPAAKPAKAKGPKRWSGNLDLGVDLIFSEKHTELYHGRAKLNYTRDRFHNTADVNGAYGNTEGSVSANQVEAQMKTDFDMKDRLYVYNLAAVGYDEIRKIDIRYQFGPGIGYHWVKPGPVAFNTELGANYQIYNFSDHTVKKEFRFRAAEDLAWKISNRFSFDEKFEFYPVVEELDDYRFRFESNIRYWFMENLSLNLTFLDNYDTTPAQRVTRNDLQIRSSVGVKF